jgi:hypothetical protein
MSRSRVVFLQENTELCLLQINSMNASPSLTRHAYPSLLDPTSPQLLPGHLNFQTTGHLPYLDFTQMNPVGSDNPRRPDADRGASVSEPGDASADPGALSAEARANAAGRRKPVSALHKTICRRSINGQTCCSKASPYQGRLQEHVKATIAPYKYPRSVMRWAGFDRAGAQRLCALARTAGAGDQTKRGCARCQRMRRGVARSPTHSVTPDRTRLQSVSVRLYIHLGRAAGGNFLNSPCALWCGARRHHRQPVPPGEAAIVAEARLIWLVVI